MRVYHASSGYEVRLRAVPVWYILQAGARVPLPEPPVEEIETVGGFVERKPARPGSPQYEEYARRLREASVERERVQFVAAVNAAVVAWRRGDEEWQRNPPDDWELPEEFSISATGNRRVDFILHEVLISPEDLEAISGATRPVTEEQIEEAHRLF